MHTMLLPDPSWRHPPWFTSGIFTWLIHFHLGWWTGRVACDMKEAAHAGSNDIVAPSLRIGTTLAETFARQLGQTRESYFTCYGAIDETGVEGGQRLITEA